MILFLKKYVLTFIREKDVSMSYKINIQEQFLMTIKRLIVNQSYKTSDTDSIVLMRFKVKEAL